VAAVTVLEDSAEFPGHHEIDHWHMELQELDEKNAINLTVIGSQFTFMLFSIE